MPKKVGGQWLATLKERKEGLEICSVDGKQIKMMAFKGTGVCSDNCRKVRDGKDTTGYGR